MPLAFDVLRPKGDEESWKITKTFLLGFFVGETFLLVLFGFIR
jgi:hypothetical protein